MVSSDRGALEQVIHQVPHFLFFVVFPWQVHAGMGLCSVCLVTEQVRTCIQVRIVSGPYLQTEPMTYID